MSDDAIHKEPVDNTAPEGESRHLVGDRPSPRGPSASTVVLGLVLAAVAALVIGHELDVVDVDPVTAGVWLLVGSGVLLVVWALVSLVGGRGRGESSG